MKYDKAYCTKFLKAQRRFATGKSYKTHLGIDGHDIHYTGSMYLVDEGRYEFIERACFAAWGDTQQDDDTGEFVSRYDEYDEVTYLDGAHSEVTYEHNIGRLEWEETDYELLYRAGWDNVIQPVFSLMPTFEGLFKNSELVFDTTKFGLKEVNHNWRMVRAFQEQQSLVTSAAWAAHIWPDFTPVEQLVLAGMYQLGPYGYTNQHFGDPTQLAVYTDGLRHHCLRDAGGQRAVQQQGHPVG